MSETFKAEPDAWQDAPCRGVPNLGREGRVIVLRLRNGAHSAESTLPVNVPEPQEPRDPRARLTGVHGCEYCMRVRAESP